MTRLVVVATLITVMGLPLAGLCAEEPAGKTTPPHPTTTSGMKAPEVAAGAPSLAETDTANFKKPASLKGKVVETMNGGGYTYVYLEKQDGEKKWVAIPEMQVTVGEQMELQPGMEMGKFSSRALKRTFDTIIFSGGPVAKTLSADDEALKKKAHEGVVMDSGKGGSASALDLENIKVEKASGPNAFTVGEVYLKKADLADHDVVVRAKVVKVSAGIMDRNWIHLRDGSGDAAKGTNNLVVTSQTMPSVGDVVTVSGILHKDKDFGRGYKYDVIVEDAAIKQKAE